jgi:4-hydroxy-4-methyl-2-oxoglutarate aldolase
MTVTSGTAISLSAATVHEPAGGLGEPIRFGDVTVHPGDLIIGDPDGVVCVPAASADQVRNKALERERAEAGYIQRLRTGETTLAIYQLP